MARSRIRFELDRAGIAEILKSPQMRDAVNETAVRVAANTRASLPEEAPVEYRAYTTDRRAATVTILHRDAAEWQRRDGLLTRAARQAGLDVRENPDPE